MREKQSRATQQRHERLLNELCQMEENRRCADCLAPSKAAKKKNKDDDNLFM